jgi:GDP-L-fucose synthase
MKKILITGKDGLVGHALQEVSKQYSNLFNFIFIGKKDCDLMNVQEIKHVLKIYDPDYIIHCAADVGGINLNMSQPERQFFNNTIMNTLLLHESMMYGIEKFINFSSICAFPNELDILVEDSLQKGDPYPSHFSYGYAKRISDIQIQIYRENQNLQYCSVIPVNVFGENDNYDLNYGHVIPSLIHKFYNAKKNNTEVTVFGDGTPKREFIYSKDLAKICFELLLLDSLPQRLITSNSEEISISELVNKLSVLFNHYKINYDNNKPNGQPRRPTNTELLKNLLPNFDFSNFDENLSSSVLWFNKNYPSVRK